MIFRCEFCSRHVFCVKQTVRARKDALDGIYFVKMIRLWLHSWGPAQRALGNKAVCISGSLQRPGVYPNGPSSSSHRQVLSACVYSLLMYHKFADTVTLESARADNQRAALTTGGDGLSSLPTMQFAYGRCHQGAGPCQLRVTCPLPLLYVIIEPICSAQQGLDGNHEAAIGKMEGKCEGVLGGASKDDSSSPREGRAFIMQSE